MSAIYLGLGGHVLALRTADGTEIWRTKLPGSSSFLSLSLVGDRLLAAHNGEVWCLEPTTGSIQWHNPLPRLGRGLISFAADPGPAAASQRASQEQAAATLALIATTALAASSD